MNRILIADQDEIICLLYEDELSESGYDVVSVTRPKDFLTAVVSNKPDLLLLCNRMLLEESIWRILVTIRNSDRSCPVILCADRLPVPEGLLKLTDGAILKSSDLRELKLKIEHLLAKNSEKIKTRGIPSEMDGFRQKMSIVQKVSKTPSPDCLIPPVPP